MVQEKFNHRPASKMISRRGFFERVSDGVYGAALATLLSKDLYGLSLLATDGVKEKEQADGHRRIYDLKPRTPHFEPKAKAVIHLFMNGGPSQVDLFDPKPMLDKHHGESYFDKIPGEVEFIKDAGALLR